MAAAGGPAAGCGGPRAGGRRRRTPRALAAAWWAAAGPAAARAEAPAGPGALPEGCAPRLLPPPRARHAADWNGVRLGPACFNGSTGSGGEDHHVFVIGDWGGVIEVQGRGPKTADHRSLHFPGHHRKFVTGADDLAQQRVAEQMRQRASKLRLDYVLNAGDSFYWGGIEAPCGAPLGCVGCDPVGQWGPIFEDMYSGDSLADKQWFGVLGNHDYGGFSFTGGWDQIIGYTWGGPLSSGRWMVPAQYWSASVYYQDDRGPWSVDYFFVDSNVHGAQEKHTNQGHNICSLKHNGVNATCGAQGPVSLDDCPRWFQRLWVEQVRWLHDALEKSEAEWQVVVTHYPPEFAKDEWRYLAAHGIDLLITGHRHNQEVHGPADPENFLSPTSYVVSGGGGGITSESLPEQAGEDDAYGFMDLTMSRQSIMIEAISHGGHLRQRAKVWPRAARNAAAGLGMDRFV